MLKRFIAILLVISCAFCLCACAGNGGKPQNTEEAGEAPQADDEYGCATLEELVDTAVKMAENGDPQLVKKLMPKGAIEFNVAKFKEKDQDYYELLGQDLKNAADKYNADVGEGWVLSYEFTDIREKEPQQYRDYDGYYLDKYGLDPEKLSAATFIYATVTVTGPNGAVSKEKSCWTFCYDGRWYSLYIPSFGLFVTGK